MMAVYSRPLRYDIMRVFMLTASPFMSLALVICMLSCLDAMLVGWPVEQAVCRFVYLFKIHGLPAAELDSDLSIWEYGHYALDTRQLLPAPVMVLEEAFDCPVDPNLGRVGLVLVPIPAEPVEPVVKCSVLLLDIEGYAGR